MFRKEPEPIKLNSKALNETKKQIIKIFSDFEIEVKDINLSFKSLFDKLNKQKIHPGTRASISREINAVLKKQTSFSIFNVETAIALDKIFKNTIINDLLTEIRLMKTIIKPSEETKSGIKETLVLDPIEAYTVISNCEKLLGKIDKDDINAMTEDDVEITKDDIEAISLDDIQTLSLFTPMTSAITTSFRPKEPSKKELRTNQKIMQLILQTQENKELKDKKNIPFVLEKLMALKIKLEDFDAAEKEKKEIANKQEEEQKKHEEERILAEKKETAKQQLELKLSEAQKNLAEIKTLASSDKFESIADALFYLHEINEFIQLAEKNEDAEFKNSVRLLKENPMITTIREKALATGLEKIAEAATLRAKQSLETVKTLEDRFLKDDLVKKDEENARVMVEFIIDEIKKQASITAEAANIAALDLERKENEKELILPLAHKIPKEKEENLSDDKKASAEDPFELLDSLNAPSEEREKTEPDLKTTEDPVELIDSLDAPTEEKDKTEPDLKIQELKDRATNIKQKETAVTDMLNKMIQAQENIRVKKEEKEDISTLIKILKPTFHYLHDIFSRCLHDKNFTHPRHQDLLLKLKSIASPKVSTFVATEYKNSAKAAMALSESEMAYYVSGLARLRVALQEYNTDEPMFENAEKFFITVVKALKKTNAKMVENLRQELKKIGFIPEKSEVIELIRGVIMTHHKSPEAKLVQSLVEERFFTTEVDVLTQIKQILENRISNHRKALQDKALKEKKKSSFTTIEIITAMPDPESRALACIYYAITTPTGSPIDALQSYLKESKLVVVSPSPSPIATPRTPRSP